MEEFRGLKALRFLAMCGGIVMAAALPIAFYVAMDELGSIDFDWSRPGTFLLVAVGGFAFWWLVDVVGQKYYGDAWDRRP